MSVDFRVRILEGTSTVYSGEFSCPVELGRQRTGEEGPYNLRKTDPMWRLIIAEHTDTKIGRQQVRIEPQASGKLMLRNLSSHAAIVIDGTEILEPQSARVTSLPVRFQCGHKVIELKASVTAGSEVNLNSLRSLNRATFVPGTMSVFAEDSNSGEGSSQFNRANLGSLKELSSISTGDYDPLIRALGVIMDVLQSARTSEEFFSCAAQGIVKLIGLDTGRVVTYGGGEWKTVMVESSNNQPVTSNVSATVLSQVHEQKRVFWDVDTSSNTDLEDSINLQGVSAVFAAPILDSTGDVIGALYGDRRYRNEEDDLNVTLKFNASLMELLASGVASGLARLDKEREVDSLRSQFEQAVTPEIAKQLEKNPKLLDGRDVETSILFCDIRRFSKLSERMQTEQIFSLIQEVLSELSECVRQYNGVLVDYIGDELMAMWGAPVEQPDHAQLACRAAMAMLNCMPKISERWMDITQEPIEVGIGINSGVVRAGNTGSQIKVKYGPLGHVVNLASRVQGTSKYLGAPLLLTGSTYADLDKSFDTRRLCNARVVNIEQPVQIYELLHDPNDDQRSKLSLYSQALDRFEQQDHNKSVQILGELLNKFPEDGPSMVLLSRAVNCMFEQSGEFSTVWELPGK